MQKQSFILDSEWYPSEIVDQAITDFSTHQISRDREVIMISDEDPQSLFDEFSNHCLALWNESI